MLLLGIDDSPDYSFVESSMATLDGLLNDITGELVAAELEEVLLHEGEQFLLAVGGAAYHVLHNVVAVLALAELESNGH